MSALTRLRGALFPILYHFYAKPKLQRKDTTTLLGFRLEVPPGVFHPRLYFSSKFLAMYLQGLDLHSLNAIDMGCGSGILSLVAASRGATVRSLDINPAAVEATRRNAEINGLSSLISAQVSNLFDSIEPQQRFDLIVFNPPFYNGIPRYPSEMAWKGGNDYAVVRSFITQAVLHLTPAGKVICVFSSDMDLEMIRRLFEQAGFGIRQVSQRNLLFEKLLIFQAQKIS